MKLLVKLTLITLFVMFLSSCDKSDQVKIAFQKSIDNNHPAIFIDKFSIETKIKNNTGVIYTATGIMKVTENTYSTIASLDDIQVIKEDYHQGDTFPFSTTFTIFDLTPTEAMIHSLMTKNPNLPYPLPFDGPGRLLKKFTGKIYIYRPQGDNSELLTFIDEIKKQQINRDQKIVKLDIENKEIEIQIEKTNQEEMILSTGQQEQIQQINDQVEEARDRVKACYKEKDSPHFIGRIDDAKIKTAYDTISTKCDELSQELSKIDYEKDNNIKLVVKPAEDKFWEFQRQKIEILDNNLNGNNAQVTKLRESKREYDYFLSSIQNKMSL